jgi:hypothetical protein
MQGEIVAAVRLWFNETGHREIGPRSPNLEQVIPDHIAMP